MINYNRLKSNKFIKVADSYAIRVVRLQQKLGRWNTRQEELKKKYTKLLEESSGKKAASLLAIPAHLAAAIMAGVNISPILYSAHSLQIENLELRALLQSVLPIVMIFFVSAYIWILIGRANLYWSQEEPGHRVLENKRFILAGIAGIVIYLAFLSHIIKMGLDQSGAEYAPAVHLIWWLSFIELFIGIAVHTGWTLAAYYIRMGYLGRKIRRAERKILVSRQNCERYYHYHVQVTPPEELYTTTNIEYVMASESFDDSASPEFINA
ncbi:MAG: hypothetical protein NXI26_10780 [bacterium]|uniref:Uncharacterized protein n=1 Tax=Phaeodactylibacter xiamenensis TaxID=1524460 RepID=A0A098S1I4_9BACT|nr:hypothetical protein [Phaeodactylibacter xiamenensis]KGE85693.1 hypothetical protein IX84_26835 [Phaeodactylibacter xiamenensis]MCR9052332.1 hypothetical protein [bacterium]